MSLQRLPRILRNHFGQQIFNDQITNVIGYGSGVFSQGVSKTPKLPSQTDIILLVKSGRTFHRMNYERNLTDYSGLTYVLGSEYLNWLSAKVFPWHSNHVKLQGIPIKYSVVSEEVLKRDIKEWNLLSLAGRFQKPLYYVTPLSSDMSLALAENYKTALKVALLLMMNQRTQKVPSEGNVPFTKIPLEQLFVMITDLSYMGDIRHKMKVENPNKSSNIVKGNMVMFQSIYLQLLKNMKAEAPTHFNQVTLDHITVKLDGKMVMYLLQGLPIALQKRIHQESKIFGADKPLQDRILLMGIKEAVLIVEQTIRRTNRKSSIFMAMENFLGASPWGNINYLSAKINRK